jgi:hypothetical protein
MKPDVITLVFLVNSFTKFGIRLNIPPIVFVSLDLLDGRPSLAFKVPLNKLLERTGVFQGLVVTWGFVRPNSKQGKNLGVWRL